LVKGIKLYTRKTTMKKASSRRPTGKDEFGDEFEAAG
jgi:hypothetical protein